MVGTFDRAKQIGASQTDTVKVKLRTEILFLRPDQIDPDAGQPRQEFDSEGLARLAESLRRYGQLQPVLVRKDGARYVLVAGERRWRAARLAGLANIQALTFRGSDAQSAQLIENLLREDLKPIEQARAYLAIMTRERWSARELARQLSIDHSGITRALKQLKLPKWVQAAIDRGEIPPTTAYEISKRPKAEHAKLAKDAIAGKLKGDDLRRMAATPAPAPKPAPEAKPTLNLGVSPRTEPWTYVDETGARFTVESLKSPKDLVAVLERALATARTAKKPLAGGLGH